MTTARARAHLHAAGFNAIGELAAADYDALVSPAWRLARVGPRASTVWVVGHGGRALWPRFEASPERGRRHHPLDAYTARVIAEALELAGPDATAALYMERRDGEFAPLVALARRAGLGEVSRLGILLHPQYGPWLGLRALLFVADAAASSAPGDFDPCTDCAAPCATACHGDALRPEGFDALRCDATRKRVNACAASCDARLACVIGPDHAYPATQLAHHMARHGSWHERS